MTTARALSTNDVSHLLSKLIGRDVSVDDIESFAPHAAASRGLVCNDATLTGVIGADLAFAHRAGTALAMIPAAAVASADSEPNPDWLEFYSEVANVLSRVVNEASTRRLRIDPGITHTGPQLIGLTEQLVGQCFAVTIEGYGTGRLGFWTLP